MSRKYKKASLLESPRPGIIGFKGAWLTVYFVAILMWLAGLAMVASAPQAAVVRIPVPVAELVWQLDASVHRLLSEKELKAEVVSAAEKARFLVVLDKLKILEAQGDTSFHGTLDVLHASAGAFFRALEAGDRPKALEHASAFREAVAPVELGVLPVKDDQDAWRADGVGYLMAAGLLLITGFAFVLRRYSLNDAYLKMIRERLHLEEQDAQLTQERLIASENQLSALRGVLEVHVKEKRKLQTELETQKSELQRQLLAKSALERNLGLKSS